MQETSGKQKRIKSKFATKVMKASLIGTVASLIAVGSFNTNFGKSLKIENFIITNRYESSMYKINQKNNIRSEINFDQIVEPTEAMKKKAKEITQNSKTADEALRKTIDYMKKFKIKTKNLPTQLPKDMDLSKEGDCNERSFYMYSLLKEIEKQSNFKFQTSLVQVYISEKGEHVNHMVLKVNSNGWKFVDTLSSNPFVNGYKLYRELNETQVVANYYEDLGSYFAMNADYNKSEQYLKIAYNLDPNSPSIIFNLSKLYSYKREERKALEYAEKLFNIEKKWIYPYVRYIQIYYSLDDHKKMEEFIKKGEEIDPENKVIKMYRGILDRIKDYSKKD
ncbi:MAG: hypothetical protein QXE90_01910 [Candidatus Micrarchaeia archaeon]